MEKTSNLSGLKKEFLEEINKSEVHVEDFKSVKVPKDVLEAEVALRKVFGDIIFEKKKQSDDVEGEKEVVKLTEEDIAFDSEVQKLTDDLIDFDFEAAVNVLLSKIAEQEEEWEKTF